jgi:hypothetical protein
MRVALEEWLARGGSVVTSTQVGTLVRQRLGPALEKRRDQVRAAMAGADAGLAPMPKGLGHTPSKSQPGHSRSGVIAAGGQAPPMRSRVPSIPGNHAPRAEEELATVRPPAPGASAMLAPQPSPVQAVAAKPAPTAARYMVAAIAGVAFALVVGGIALAIALAMRSHSGEASTVEPPSSPPAAIVAPVAPPTPHVPSAVVSAPAQPSAVPAPSTSAAAPASASSAPTSVDVTDLPTAKPQPWWATGQAPPLRTTPAAPPPQPAIVPRQNQPPPNPF